MPLELRIDEKPMRLLLPLRKTFWHSGRSIVAMLLVLAVAPNQVKAVQAPQGQAAELEPRNGYASVAERAEAVDRLLEPWNRPESPGAAVLVLKDGEAVHRATYGSADLEHGIPILLSTVFDVASVAKQVTGLAIAMLLEDGRIGLEDDVRSHIPELPDFGDPIRVRHLLYHTSGLRDWPGALMLAGWDLSDVLSLQQILDMTYRQTELNFRPGEEFAYSNTGYNLLAEIVSRVTGMPFHEWAEEQIFRPLGMIDTHFRYDHRAVVPRRARSYVPATGGFIEMPSQLTAVGSSSLFTTIRDVELWLRNFDDPVVGGAAAIERMQARGALNNGEPVDYGYGLAVEEDRGTVAVGHGGFWAGYRAKVLRFPEHGFAVAILSNAGNLDADALAVRVAEIYLGDRLTSPAPSRFGPGAPPTLGGVGWWPGLDELEIYEGEYHSVELNSTYQILAREGRLIARHVRTGDQVLRPIAPDHFQGGAFGVVRFVRGDGDAVRALISYTNRVRNLRFDRVP